MDIQKTLEAASRIADIYLVREVLAGYKPVNAVYEESGETALHMAVNSGYALLVEALLEKEIEVNAATWDGYTALHYSCLGSNQTIVKLLLDRGAAVNARTQDEELTPIYLAAAYDKKEIAELLLDRGADIDISNEEGRTPLYEAVSASFDTMVALLLGRGAKVNVKENGGNTPLYRAVSARDNSQKELIIQLLLRYGAYSYRNVDSDKHLQKYWRSSYPRGLGSNNEAGQSFYTALLLAGVRVPRGVVLPESLLLIRHRIEAAVSMRLAPLALSPESCARLMPAVLRALPRLIEWINFILDFKAQIFGGKLFEATIGNAEDTVFLERFQRFAPESGLTPAQWWEALLCDLKDNQVLIQALEKKVPEEVREGVKDAFIQKNLAALVVNRVQKMYNLPLRVTVYLVDEVRQHLTEYAAFHRDIFTHDWLFTPCKQPRQQENAGIDMTPSKEVALSLY